MELEKQVCSLEFAKKLKKLGAEQSSLWYWVQWVDEVGGRKYTELTFHESPQLVAHDVWSAFTVAELGEMLAEQKSDDFYRVRFHSGKDSEGFFIEWMLGRQKGTNTEYGDTEADARTRMLIYLLENKIIGNSRHTPTTHGEARLLVNTRKQAR
jgi:hypothetical protein